MRIEFNIAQTELGKFRTACNAAIYNIGGATKAASIAAAEDIMSSSMAQVPVDTGALVFSAYYGVARRTDLKNYRYGAVLGYGVMPFTNVEFGPIEWIIPPTNRVNPKNGLEASTYAAIVHEDLDMPHPRGGKAKFLEDPVREYAAGRFARTIAEYWKTAIVYSNTQPLATRYHARTRTWHYKSRKERHYKLKQQRSDVIRGPRGGSE